MQQAPDNVGDRNDDWYWCLDILHGPDAVPATGTCARRVVPSRAVVASAQSSLSAAMERSTLNWPLTLLADDRGELCGGWSRPTSCNDVESLCLVDIPIAINAASENYDTEVRVCCTIR